MHKLHLRKSMTSSVAVRSDSTSQILVQQVFALNPIYEFSTIAVITNSGRATSSCRFAGNDLLPMGITLPDGYVYTWTSAVHYSRSTSTYNGVEVDSALQVGMQPLLSSIANLARLTVCGGNGFFGEATLKIGVSILTTISYNYAQAEINGASTTAPRPVGSPTNLRATATSVDVPVATPHATTQDLPPENPQTVPAPGPATTPDSTHAPATTPAEVPAPATSVPVSPETPLVPAASQSPEPGPIDPGSSAVVGNFISSMAGQSNDQTMVVIASPTTVPIPNFPPTTTIGETPVAELMPKQITMISGTLDVILPDAKIVPLTEFLHGQITWISGTLDVVYSASATVPVNTLITGLTGRTTIIGTQTYVVLAHPTTMAINTGASTLDESTTIIGGETVIVGGVTTTIDGIQTVVGGQTEVTGGSTVIATFSRQATSAVIFSESTSVVGGKTTVVGGTTMTISGVQTMVGGKTEVIGGSTIVQTFLVQATGVSGYISSSGAQCVGLWMWWPCAVVILWMSVNWMY